MALSRTHPTRSYARSLAKNRSRARTLRRLLRRRITYQNTSLPPPLCLCSALHCFFTAPSTLLLSSRCPPSSNVRIALVFFFTTTRAPSCNHLVSRHSSFFRFHFSNPPNKRRARRVIAVGATTIVTEERCLSSMRQNPPDFCFCLLPSLSLVGALCVFTH